MNPCRPGAVYDSNAAIIGAAVEELGGIAVHLGVIADNEQALAAALTRGLESDVVVFSGGTSKGAGDVSYRIVHALRNPGVVAHGVALKPGKPICLAVTGGKPVVILPGFPTSAIFTFHEFLAPVIRAFAGLPPERRHTVPATLPMRVNSERGRTEYLLVGLVQGPEGYFAYPMGKGSGSVTTFSGADGFITIDQHTEILDSGSAVAVTLLAQQLEPADLVIIGSHCVGLDLLVGKLMRQGVRTKLMVVGSMGGLAAAKRGECDIAGVHLMDPATGEYNRPMLTDSLTLVAGYGRMQGFLFRRGDARFEGKSLDEAVAAATGRCSLCNGQSQRWKRHAHHHRQTAGGQKACRIRHANKVPQRRCGGDHPAASGLGNRDRYRGSAIRARLHPDAGRGIRLHRTDGTVRAPGGAGFPRVAE